MRRRAVTNTKGRLAIIAAVAAVITVAWLTLRSPGVELIDEELVTGQVIELLNRQGTMPANTGERKGLGIVVVELPDGGRARVFTLLSQVSVGGDIPLKVKIYSDDSRHVIRSGDQQAQQSKTNIN